MKLLGGTEKDVDKDKDGENRVIQKEQFKKLQKLQEI